MKDYNVTMCFMVSPRYISKEEAALQASEFDPIKKLCNQYGIHFFNHTYMKGISEDSILFQDYGHMNIRGAHLYSKYVCSEIKSLIK
jgi:hypothetical protein